MPVIYLDQSDFTLQNINLESPKLQSTDITFLLIKAEWCGHCNRYLPIYEQYSVKYPNINFCVVEETENSKLLNEDFKKLVFPAFKVEGFPTVVLYNHDGSPIKVIENRIDLDSEITQQRLKN